MYPGGEYACAAMRRSAAGICEAEGFTHAEVNALELLGAATARYIEAVGQHAQHLAELAGRSQANLVDLSSAFQQCEASFGPFACEDPQGDECEMGEEDCPWVELPAFPVVAQEERNRLGSSLALSAEDIEEVQCARKGHIPSFLPPFPPSWQRLHKQPAARLALPEEGPTFSKEATLQALWELSEEGPRVLAKTPSPVAAPVGIFATASSQPSRIKIHTLVRRPVDARSPGAKASPGAAQTAVEAATPEYMEAARSQSTASPADGAMATAVQPTVQPTAELAMPQPPAELVTEPATIPSTESQAAPAIGQFAALPAAPPPAPAPAVQTAAMPAEPEKVLPSLPPAAALAPLTPPAMPEHLLGSPAAVMPAAYPVALLAAEPGETPVQIPAQPLVQVASQDAVQSATQTAAGPPAHLIAQPLEVAHAAQAPPTASSIEALDSSQPPIRHLRLVETGMPDEVSPPRLPRTRASAVLAGSPPPTRRSTAAESTPAADEVAGDSVPRRLQRTGSLGLGAPASSPPPARRSRVFEPRPPAVTRAAAAAAEAAAATAAAARAPVPSAAWAASRAVPGTPEALTSAPAAALAPGALSGTAPGTLPLATPAPVAPAPAPGAPRMASLAVLPTSSPPRATRLRTPRPTAEEVAEAAPTPPLAAKLRRAAPFITAKASGTPPTRVLRSTTAAQAAAAADAVSAMSMAPTAKAGRIVVKQGSAANSSTSALAVGLPEAGTDMVEPPMSSTPPSKRPRRGLRLCSAPSA
uniref:Bromodomain associated domain-containing protein n=1 Tax=Pyrodinium bahamense TaxID=73915 RepID=A0A7S0ASX9_9DINO|mmetsp:Transcript_41578/g.115691  ORF Transcript_41578/g.115691 Transcript_41578/m.115691 type:complete len:758 (+) Transcript_41578:55-2328(+)